MKTYYDLPQVREYIEKNKIENIKDKEKDYQRMLKIIKIFKKIDKNTKILEIGTGLGWFPILCNINGISCDGIDISPQLVNYAKKLGKKNNIEPKIIIGNIETENIGSSKYDIIIASSVFEHVKYWRIGIQKIYKALKPEGLFYISTTNKFSLRSGEFYIPFYGWLPNKLRFKIRQWYDKDIMKLGIDFNQFTYFHLRRYLKSIGFSSINDFWGMVAHINDIKIKDSFLSNSFRKVIFTVGNRFTMLKNLFLFFYTDVVFICIK